MENFSADLVKQTRNWYPDIKISTALYLNIERECNWLFLHFQFFFFGKRIKILSIQAHFLDLFYQHDNWLTLRNKNSIKCETIDLVSLGCRVSHVAGKLSINNSCKNFILFCPDPNLVFPFLRILFWYLWYGLNGIIYDFFI